jgi:hypothetical protein
VGEGVDGSGGVWGDLGVQTAKSSVLARIVKVAPGAYEEPLPSGFVFQPEKLYPVLMSVPGGSTVTVAEEL